jgi:hypothetical protein
MANDTSRKKKVTAKVQGVAVPLKWNIPENIITRFASNIVVQRLEDAFKISFFEIYPDIRLGLEHKIPEEVQANCVASIILTPEKLPVFIEVLQKQRAMYEISKSKPIVLTDSDEP